MTMPPAITITAEPASSIEVELVGTLYKIKPPKASLALKLAVRAKTAGDNPELMLATVDEWVSKAFGKAGAAKIQKRLDDPEDALDIGHIMILMEKVITVSTPDPTS